MDATNNRNKAESKAQGDEPLIIDVDTENANDVTNVEDEKKDANAKRSWIWNHFKHAKGVTQVQCPYCKTTLAAGTRKNGTSSMASHLNNVCKKSPVYKKPDLKNQSKLGFKPTNKPGTGDSLASHSFSQEKCRKAFVRIKDNRPFSVIDDEGLRELLWELNPLFKVPSRRTIARDCLSKYKEEKKKLKDNLKGQTVSLTTDTWMSVQNYNYMCFTAHWVDDDWVLRKKILNFCQIANHRGVTIGKLVYRCLQEWGH